MSIETFANVGIQIIAMNLTNMEPLFQVRLFYLGHSESDYIKTGLAQADQLSGKGTGNTVKLSARWFIVRAVHD